MRILVEIFKLFLGYLFFQTKDISEKCCDYRSLDMAVDNNDVEVLTFLLDHIRITEKHYYCAILRAVYNDSIDIVETLLQKYVIIL